MPGLQRADAPSSFGGAVDELAGAVVEFDGAVVELRGTVGGLLGLGVDVVEADDTPPRRIRPWWSRSGST
jgi:hypothetical protein